jgi:hypothetical protein
VEILRGGPVPTKYILEGRALELGDYIKNAGNGQQTFDQDLLALHRQELISTSEALRNATNRDSLTMALRGIKSSKAVSEAGGGHRPAPVPQQQPRDHDEDGQNHGGGGGGGGGMDRNTGRFQPRQPPPMGEH